MKTNPKILKLLQCIRTCKSEDYMNLILSLGLTKEDFTGQINFSDKKYTRTCIANEGDFELILLAWSKGQKAPIHNHDGNEGFIYVLEGELEEVCYLNESLEKQSVGKLSKNQVSYATNNPLEFHSIENTYNGNSLSLHLYKKPIEKCLVFDATNNKLVTKELAYDFE